MVDNAKRYAQTTIKIILKNDELVIYNDGEHIDEQFLKAEFKPYEKGSKGQFGLGMSIVVKTLDFFNMKLRVKKMKNVGVSFIITKK
ncbi:MAG: ATP-binding protein [Clostridium sp.]|nr:MAG: ATP-binding protein [Clostridium sp.]